MPRRAALTALACGVAAASATAFAGQERPRARAAGRSRAHAAVTNVYAYWSRENKPKGLYGYEYKREGNLVVCPATRTWGVVSCSEGTFRTYSHKRKKGKRVIEFKETVFYGEREYRRTELIGIVRPDGNGWKNGKYLVEGYERGQWYAKKR